MSYYAADVNGYLGDAASIGGWRDFCLWIDAVNEAIVTKKFVYDGVTLECDALAEELETLHCPVASVDSTRRNLADLARRANHMLIVTDGMTHV